MASRNRCILVNQATKETAERFEIYLSMPTTPFYSSPRFLELFIKCFIMFLLNPNNNLISPVSLFLFYRRGNRGSQRLRDFSKSQKVAGQDLNPGLFLPPQPTLAVPHGSEGSLEDSVA